MRLRGHTVIGHEGVIADLGGRHLGGMVGSEGSKYRATLSPSCQSNFLTGQRMVGGARRVG